MSAHTHTHLKSCLFALEIIFSSPKSKMRIKRKKTQLKFETVSVLLCCLMQKNILVMHYTNFHQIFAHVHVGALSWNENWMKNILFPQLFLVSFFFRSLINKSLLKITYFHKPWYILSQISLQTMQLPIYLLYDKKYYISFPCSIVFTSAANEIKTKLG